MRSSRRPGRRDRVRGNPIAAGSRGPKRMGSWGDRPLRDPFPRVAITRMAEAGRSLLAEGSADAIGKATARGMAPGLQLHDYRSAGANQ